MHARIASMVLVLSSALGCSGESTSDGGPDGASSDSASCAEGALFCACEPGERCDPGLRCESGVCAVCPAGALGCPCEGGACDGALVCMADVCAPASCELGTEGCPCDGGACDTGLACVAAMCQPCAADAVGCPCPGGTCSAGLVCDAASSCRAPLACADLVASGVCSAHQVCVEAGAGTDASCPDAECETGWRWSSSSRRCVQCVSADCLTEPTCDPPSTVLDDCDAQNRECELDADEFAFCAGCKPTYAEIGGTCIAGVDCGGVSCDPEEYCAEGPACVPRPCSDPSYAIPPGTTSCVNYCSPAPPTMPPPCRCTLDCAAEGSSGRVWPFRTSFGNCICETLPGYFIRNGGDGRPQACDADSDGWVNDDAGDLSITGPMPDPALAANMRCDIRSIDRVQLVNDMGQSLVVHSCDQGLLVDPPPECIPDPFPLRLLESERNDTSGRPATTSTVNPYPTPGGRVFAAAELNALTKACIDSIGDYNDDGPADIAQAQPTPVDTSSLDETARLRSFAHFIELHTVHYEPPATGSVYGRLVIAERSRCSADFPIRYDDRTAYDADDGSTYWRSCERRRDPTFDAAFPVPGYDFAQYSCLPARSGSCPVAPVPAHPTLAEMPDPAQALVRGHGACELGAALPADGFWRGMNHHSQFRCVEVVGNVTMSSPRYQVEIEDFAPPRDGNLRLVECTIGGSTPRPFGGADPQLTCPLEIAELGFVGMAIVRYLPYGHRTGTSAEGTPSGTYANYRGGCVNEDAEWRQTVGTESHDLLCPAPEFERCPTAPINAFGRYRCHGQESSFLWADDDETAAPYRRSSLLFADDIEPVEPVNMSFWAGDSTICM